MNPNLDHALHLARIHDLARHEAQRLRREALAALFETLGRRLRAWLAGRRAPQWPHPARPTGAR